MPTGRAVLEIENLNEREHDLDWNDRRQTAKEEIADFRIPIQRDAIQRDAIQRDAMQRDAIQRDAMQCDAMRYKGM